MGLFWTSKIDKQIVRNNRELDRAMREERIRAYNQETDPYKKKLLGELIGISDERIERENKKRIL